MKFISLFILLVCHQVYANPSSSQVEEVEKVLLAEIKKKNSSEKDKFLLYNLAARELYNYKFYDRATHYYKKVLTLNVTDDKREAYVNLMAIEFAKDKNISKSTYTEALKYFEKTKKINEPELKRYMDFINENFFSKNPSKEFRGFYGEFSKQRSLKKLIEKKSYKEALSLMNTNNIDDRDLVTKIKYDLLRSLSFGKKKLKLSCESSLKKYPHSIAWTMEICRGLVKYQKGTSPSKKDIERVEESAREQKSSSQYLASAFGELK